MLFTVIKYGNYLFKIVLNRFWCFKEKNIFQLVISQVERASSERDSFDFDLNSINLHNHLRSVDNENIEGDYC